MPSSNAKNGVRLPSLGRIHVWFALGLVISALWTLGCRSFTPLITAQSSTDRIAANSPTSPHHSAALPPAKPAVPTVPAASQSDIRLASFADQEPQSTTFRVDAADPLVIDPSPNIRPQATASGVASPAQSFSLSSQSTQATETPPFSESLSEKGSEKGSGVRKGV